MFIFPLFFLGGFSPDWLVLLDLTIFRVAVLREYIRL